MWDHSVSLMGLSGLFFECLTMVTRKKCTRHWPRQELIAHLPSNQYGELNLEKKDLMQ